MDSVNDPSDAPDPLGSREPSDQRSEDPQHALAASLDLRQFHDRRPCGNSKLAENLSRPDPQRQRSSGKNQLRQLIRRQAKDLLFGVALDQDLARPPAVHDFMLTDAVTHLQRQLRSTVNRGCTAPSAGASTRNRPSAATS